MRTIAAAQTIVGRAEAADAWHLIPPDRSPAPISCPVGRIRWRRARRGFAVLALTLRANARRLSRRIGAGRQHIHAAVPYCAIALALLTGSVFGLLYAPSAQNPATIAPSATPPNVHGGEQPALRSLEPAANAAIPEPSRQAFGMAAVALAAVAPDRIAGAARAAPNSPEEQSSPAPEPPSWDRLHTALYQLGYAFQRQGADNEAIALYRRAAALGTEHAATLYNWGYILQQRGEPDAAMIKYRQAIEVDPEHFYAHYNLGWLLQKKGEAEAAIDQYQRAAALDSTNPYVYYNWAYILEKDGEIADALRLYARALEIAPERRPGTDAHQRIAALHLDRVQHLASH